jgi:hypothetical protein
MLAKTDDDVRKFSSNERERGRQGEQPAYIKMLESLAKK